MKAIRTKKHENSSASPRNRKFTIEDIWAELQSVRGALEKSERRAQKLERRVEVLEAENRELREENRALREKRGKTEEHLQKKIRKLEKAVADRDRKIQKQTKQLAWFRKNFFGKQSEGLDQKPEEAEPSEPTKPKSNGRKNRGQQRGSKGHGRTDRGNVPVVETVTLEIPGGCSCPDCGKPYLVLSKTKDSTIFDLAIDLFQTLYKQLKYVSQCGCRGKKIVEAPGPPKLYPRTDIGNSLWVHLLVQKFLQGVPTNRTLKELSLYGFSLAEGTVAGGCKIINTLLIPLQEAIVNHCRGGDLWNADETKWRVFDEQWWLWIVASSDAVVYILDPSRSKKVPKEFFAGSAGTLMTDRLASYKALQDSIRNAWCWVHQRRDFLNIYNGVKELKQWAKRWLLKITQLFLLYETRFRLWAKNQTSGPEWVSAQKALKQCVEDLKKSWQRQLKQSDLHDEQATVLRSLQRHWEGLTLFIKDPAVPLHNNRAERLIRHCVTLRKSSYGSGAQWSGELAAKLFSLFQTWLINGLDPHALLLEYLNECSKTPGRPPPDVRAFLPWTMSPERKQLFALPATYKRPG